MKLPSKTVERNLFESGYQYVCAVDEVGMGSLAGPVVVCAVGITDAFYKNYRRNLKGLRESKLLSSFKRELFAQELMKEKDLAYVVSLCYPKKIDEVNIYQASRIAMRRAVKRLLYSKQIQNFEPKNPNSKIIVLVDGPHTIKNLKFDQLAIVKGDQKVFAIACASIIAKVYRDKMMRRYGLQYPVYGFEQHKGYNTKLHQSVLNQLGPCAIHRRSFRLKY